MKRQHAHQDEPTWVTRTTPLQPQDTPLERCQVNITPDGLKRSQGNYTPADKKNDNCIMM